MLRWLDVPVMLVPEGCQFWMSFAPIGSVMPANTTGMVLVAAATACALGVVMATMTSGLSPANFLAISHWAGQGAPMIREMPAAQLVATLAREWQTA